MLVSVIIPAFNSEKYIDKCLTSVCNQTYNNIEILIIDDASTDGTYSIIERYRKNDNRVKIIRHHENKGNGRARNTAILEAKGEYILFVDSDDYIEIDAIEKLMNYVKDKLPQVVFFGHKINICSQTGEIKNSQLFTPSLPEEEEKYVYIERFLFHSGVRIQVWTYFFKRTLLINNKILFDESGRHFEDFIFTAKLFCYVDKIDVLKEPLYNYHVRQGTILTNKEPQNIHDRILATKHVCEYIKEIDSEHIHNDACLYFYIQHAFVLAFLHYTKIKPNKELRLYFKQLVQSSLVKNFDIHKLKFPQEILTDKQLIKRVKQTHGIVKIVSKYPLLSEYWFRFCNHIRAFTQN